MYRIVHVHFDHKFYHNINNYSHSLIENTLLILAEKSDVNVAYQESATFFEPNPENLDKIVSFVSEFDMVVFANLTHYSRKILMRLPKNIKVVWWFFGHEFYSTRLDLTLSEKSIKAVGNDYVIRKKKTFNDYISFLRFRLRQIKSFYTYSKKIDAIIMISKEEYSFVKKHLVFLPKLLTSPLSHHQPESFDYHIKENYIILGNSRNMNNNHLDIIDFIKNHTNPNKYGIKMFLNYGHEKSYWKILLNKISGIPHIEPITEFKNPAEFKQIYHKANALVINSYRQMALGNIFTAIRNNCKIYLNDKNVIKKWLINEGLFIFSIEDFKKDYENNNLVLTFEQAKHNNLKFNDIIKKNTNDNFQKNILNILQHAKKNKKK